MQRTLNALFGPPRAAAVADDIAPVAGPPVHPLTELLALLDVGSLEEIESAAIACAERGEPPGRVVELRGADGRLLTLRPKQYRTLLEAGVDGRIARIETDHPARAAEAARLAPVARREALLRDLRALRYPPASENASWGKFRAVPAAPVAVMPPAPAPVTSVTGYEENRRDLAEQRRRIERERIEALPGRFAAAETLRTAVPPPPRADGFAEHVRLIDELTTWAEEHPDLDARCRAAEAAGA